MLNHRSFKSLMTKGGKERKIKTYYKAYWASLVAQTVKNLPALQDTEVRSLGWKDPLEEKTATHSSILAWRIPWTEEPGELQSMGYKESNTTERLMLSLS